MKHHLTQADLIIIRGYLDIAKLAVLKENKPESDTYKLTDCLINELQNKIDKDILQMHDHRRIPE